MNLDIEMSGKEWEKDFRFSAKSNGEVLRGITALSIDVREGSIPSAKIELEFFRDEDGLDIHLRDIDATATVVIGGKTYRLVEVDGKEKQLGVIEVSGNFTTKMDERQAMNRKKMPDMIYCFGKHRDAYAFWIELRSEDFTNGKPVFWKQCDPSFARGVGLEFVGQGPKSAPGIVKQAERVMIKLWDDYCDKLNESESSDES